MGTSCVYFCCAKVIAEVDSISADKEIRLGSAKTNTPWPLAGGKSNTPPFSEKSPQTLQPNSPNISSYYLLVG